MGRPRSWPFPPPLTPARLRPARVIPQGSGWAYEPKWDGFRSLLWCGPSPILQSRNGASLGEAFPEVAAATGDLPPGSVLDGELVIFFAGISSFDALSLRLRHRSQAPAAAAHSPATFVAFDVLAFEGEDLRHRPLQVRRRLLEEVVGERERVVVTPSTTERTEAQEWWHAYRSRGCEGLVAKPIRSSYRENPGWLKMRREETVDLVVCGYRTTAGGRLLSLLLGAGDADGGLVYVGEARIPAGTAEEELGRLLQRLHRPEERTWSRGPWLQNRWEQFRDTTWEAIEPVLVVEVAYDRLDASGIFRHPARILRIRPDKSVSECRPPSPLIFDN